MRPSRGAPGGASGKRVVAGLVGDLPPQVHAAHAGVPPVDPAVDGGLREPELRMDVGDLLGRDAAREAVPDDADLLLELPLALVHSEPGLAQGRVRRPLGHRGPVVDLRPDGAAVAATPIAAVAAPGPLSKTRADLLQVPWGRVSVACPGRGHEAVAHDLVVDGRGGPADFVSDLPDWQVAVEALLDGPPVSLGEARVRPLPLPLLPAWPLCQLWSSLSGDVLGRRHCRPDVTGVHNTAVLVRMTLRSVRVKSEFEVPC